MYTRHFSPRGGSGAPHRHRGQGPLYAQYRFDYIKLYKNMVLCSFVPPPRITGITGYQVKIPVKSGNSGNSGTGSVGVYRKLGIAEYLLNIRPNTEYSVFGRVGKYEPNIWPSYSAEYPIPSSF